MYQYVALLTHHPTSSFSGFQMAMLLKLQEAANYIESPDKETPTDPSLPRL